jgi:hypothetical protein
VLNKFFVAKNHGQIDYRNNENKKKERQKGEKGYVNV